MTETEMEAYEQFLKRAIALKNVSEVFKTHIEDQLREIARRKDQLVRMRAGANRQEAEATQGQPTDGA